MGRWLDELWVVVFAPLFVAGVNSLYRMASERTATQLHRTLNAHLTRAKVLERSLATLNAKVAIRAGQYMYVCGRLFFKKMKERERGGGGGGGD